MRDRKLTGRQERYARALFEGVAEGKAYLEAGYSPKAGTMTVAANASRLAKNVKVLARLAELRKAAEDASVATVLERKQVLTEISRGRFADFTDGNAAIQLTKDNLKSPALQEVSVKPTKYGRIHSIKLHSPIQAIAELNKMEKVYIEGGSTINIDNRSVNIDVKEELIGLLSRIAARIGEAQVNREPDPPGS